MTALTILAAFLRRDWGITRSYRFAYLFTIVATLFHLAIYFFIGRLIDQTNLSGYEGLEQGYFSFAILGMVMLNLASTSLSTFSATLRTEQTTGSLEALLATPASPSLLILGAALHSFFQALLNGTIFISLAVIFFGVRFETGLWLLMTAIVAAVALVVFFGAVGIAVAGFTIVFKQTGSMIGVVLYGLSLLGGVYFPIEILPEPLRLLAAAVPLNWGLRILRTALLDGEAQPLLLVPLVAAAVLSVPVAHVVFNAALGRARRDGSLNQY